MIVTFDLFSALIDSRSGGAAVFDRLATVRRWDVAGAELYDRWDAHNKAGQREASREVARDGSVWVSFRELSERALARVYEDLGLEADPRADLRVLHTAVPSWPLWPDVATGVENLRATYALGILSNVDDALFGVSPAAPLFDDAWVLTSERLRAYKPGPHIYRRAAEQTGGHVHVASSARDVRGSLAAGLPTVRLVRPGHDLDQEGPRPAHVAESLRELADVLARLGRS